VAAVAYEKQNFERAAATARFRLPFRRRTLIADPIPRAASARPISCSSKAVFGTLDQGARAEQSYCLAIGRQTREALVRPHVAPIRGKPPATLQFDGVRAKELRPCDLRLPCRSVRCGESGGWKRKFWWSAIRTPPSARRTTNHEPRTTDYGLRTTDYGKRGASAHHYIRVMCRSAGAARRRDFLRKRVT
jgi:hypothetical protein